MEKEIINKILRELMDNPEINTMYYKELSKVKFKYILAQIFSGCGGSFAHLFLLKELDFIFDAKLEDYDDVIDFMGETNTVGISTLYEFFVFHTNTDLKEIELYFGKQGEILRKITREDSEDFKRFVEAMYDGLNLDSDKLLLLSNYKFPFK